MMFRSRGDGIEIRMAARHRRLLADVKTLLEDVGDEDDPAHAVLNRSAHRDDPSASREFASLIAEDLASQRRADRDVVQLVASGERELSREDAISFMRAINEARLVLAARTGILTDDPQDAEGWERRIPTDPVVAAIAWLSYLEAELLQSLVTGA